MTETDIRHKGDTFMSGPRTPYNEACDNVRHFVRINKGEMGLYGATKAGARNEAIKLSEIDAGAAIRLLMEYGVI